MKSKTKVPPSAQLLACSGGGLGGLAAVEGGKGVAGLLRIAFNRTKGAKTTKCLLQPNNNCRKLIKNQHCLSSSSNLVRMLIAGLYTQNPPPPPAVEARDSFMVETDKDWVVCNFPPPFCSSIRFGRGAKPAKLCQQATRLSSV